MGVFLLCHFLSTGVGSVSTRISWKYYLIWIVGFRIFIVALHAFSSFVFTYLHPWYFSIVVVTSVNTYFVVVLSRSNQSKRHVSPKLEITVSSLFHRRFSLQWFYTIIFPLISIRFKLYLNSLTFKYLYFIVDFKLKRIDYCFWNLNLHKKNQYKYFISS